MERCALVSIVVNNYNYERFVGEAIESALGQDYLNVEVVVVDDGSTDNSRDIISRYGDRISSIFQINGGQGAAYNSGFAACHGDFVIFLDADDRLHRNAVTEVVKEFRAGISKVQFALRLIDGEGRPLGRALLDGCHDPSTFRPLLKEFLLYPSPPSSGNAYSRPFLERRLPLPPDLWRRAADGYLILAAPVDGNIAHIGLCLGDYRRHGSGVSDMSARSLHTFVEREYNKNVVARNHVTQVLASSTLENGERNYGMPPTHLKFMIAEAFLCRPERVPVSARLEFFKEATRTAKGWKPWPVAKRLLLILWVLLICCCPRYIRRGFLLLSMEKSGY